MGARRFARGLGVFAVQLAVAGGIALAVLVPLTSTYEPPGVQTRFVATPSPPVPTATPPLPDLPEGYVALTFDDGPDPVMTPLVLDVLDHYNVKATFFVVGRAAQAHPELILSIVGRGHVIAGHSWSHRRLTGGGAAVAREVDRANDYLEELTGQQIKCVRPPGGYHDHHLEAILQARGLELAMWTVDPRDWSKPGVGRIVDKVERELQPGAVILLHDGGGDRRQSVIALPLILQAIADEDLGVLPICA